MTDAKKVNLEGKVLGIERHINGIKLIVDTGEERCAAKLPIKIATDFELIPYVHALLGETVRYEQVKEVQHDCGMTGFTNRTTRYQLIILSGKMEGKPYSGLEY